MKPYPKYKESGVAWLGKVPEHWVIRPLFVLVRETKKRNQGNVEANLLSLSYGQIVRKDAESNFGLLPESFETYQIVHKGNLILRLTDLQNDKRSLRVGLVQERGIITSAYVCIVPQKDFSEEFAYVLLHTYDLWKVFYGMGSGVRQSMVFEDLKRLPVLLPPLPEQRAIAAYLDRETAKIDTLIAKQEQLIALLEEKRQALISHAVTKGLDPNVKMKDSGVEWLGQVPEHWEVQKIKSLFEIRKRIAGVLGYSVLAITQKGLKIKNLTSGEGQLSMDYSKYQIVKPGDFAMNHMDLLTGGIGIAAFEGVTSPDYRVFTLTARGQTPEYYLRFFEACYQQKIFYHLGQGSSHFGRWRLPTQQFNAFLVPVPPNNEQQAIVNFLQKSISKYDELQNGAIKAIELLKEKRSALISAAVTGKIDVRDQVLT